MTAAPPQSPRFGFSLIELIVVMAILGLLAALILTAVQSAREAARRTECGSKLHELGIAIASYESANGEPPPGRHRGFSYLVEVLPYVEQTQLHTALMAYNEYDIGMGESYSPVSAFHCPSDDGTFIHGAYAEDPELGELQMWAATSYHGNFGTGVQKFGYNGYFRSGRSVTAAMISDGTSNTAAVSEALVGDGSDVPLRTIYHTQVSMVSAAEFEDYVKKCSEPSFWKLPGDNWNRGRPWTSGQLRNTYYNHAATPNTQACYNGDSVRYGNYPATSNHNDSVNVLFADGHLDTISENIDLETWRKLGSRDGEGDGT